MNHTTYETVMAEFESAEAMERASELLAGLGHDSVDTFAPFDVAKVDTMFGAPRSRIGKIAFVGGLAGLVLGYVVQWWGNVHAYPMNSGGRPVDAAPAFALVAFENAVLGAAFTAVVALLVALRFPQLWAREDIVDGFERASIDTFWIRVDVSLPAEARSDVRRFLEQAGATRVVHLQDA